MLTSASWQLYPAVELWSRQNFDVVSKVGSVEPSIALTTSIGINPRTSRLLVCKYSFHVFSTFSIRFFYLVQLLKRTGFFGKTIWFRNFGGRSRGAGLLLHGLATQARGSLPHPKDFSYAASRVDFEPFGSCLHMNEGSMQRFVSNINIHGIVRVVCSASAFFRPTF